MNSHLRAKQISSQSVDEIVARMSAAICGFPLDIIPDVAEPVIGAHSRDPLAHLGYALLLCPLPPSQDYHSSASAGTFLPVRGSVTGDGILARSGTVSAKAMRCNARLAFVLSGSLREEPTASGTAARLLKRPASRRGTDLRVARTGEEFVDCDHRGASDDGNGRHHENGFDHGSLPTDLNAKTPEESCSGKTRELRGSGLLVVVRSGS